MKLYLLSNKSLRFDTRVREMQHLLTNYFKNVEYTELLVSSSNLIVNILQQNYSWFILIFKVTFRGNRANTIAYFPDVISIYKAWPYIVLGGRFILDIHDYEHDRAPLGRNFHLRKFFSLLILRFAVNKATAVVTVSKLMSRYYSRFYQCSHKKLVYLYNSFYTDACNSNCLTSNYSISNLSNDKFRIGFVGMKSTKRGSDELLDSIRNHIINNSSSIKDIEFVWLGSGIDNYNNDISTKYLSAFTVNTRLLCQCCLARSVQTCDLLIHAYKPDYANSRHAVPNKLFTFLNYSKRNTIIVGDYECRRLINNKNYIPRHYWISTKHSWDDTLDLINNLTLKVYFNFLNSKQFESNNENGFSYSFENYNSVQLNKLMELCNE